MKKSSNLYILVEATRVSNGKRYTKAFESFDELKGQVVNILNARGWDNKGTVDLRKTNSCLNYVLSGNFRDIEYKFTTSYSKFMDYRYGSKAIV